MVYITGIMLLKTENVFNCSRNQHLVTAALGSLYKFSYFPTERETKEVTC